MKRNLTLLLSVVACFLCVEDTRAQAPTAPPAVKARPAGRSGAPPIAPDSPVVGTSPLNPGGGAPPGVVPNPLQPTVVPGPPASDPRFDGKDARDSRGTSGGGTKAVVGANGKASGDTTNLSQFEQGVEFAPRSPNYKVAFSLEDADLPELVRVIGQLTGKRFIFGGKIRSIKASVYSPQKVTVAEAYQAFLSILDANGLTVIPHGRFLKIVETGGIVSQSTPLFDGQNAPVEDRYVTRLHRLSHVSADEVAGVLGKFKTKDGDIVVYGPGNLLIITDTGANIRRMMQIVQDIDVGGAGDQIWIEPVHYASATDVASRINDLFDIKGGGAAAPGAAKGGSTPASVGGGGTGGEMHVAKIVPDDRTNSLVIVATERAYLRILELIKRIDVPQTGEGEIHVLPLQHADAVELTKTISEIITGAGGATGSPGGAAPPSAGKPGAGAPQGIFEGGVRVSADKATNSIVVTSSLRDYASLRAVVDRLDLPRRQVFIEAVIMDLSIQRQDTLGVNFHAADTVATLGQGDSLLYGGLNPLKTILLPTPDQLNGLALGVRGPGIPGSENLLGTGLSIPAFGAVINAIATSSDADVLSTPHILATDNIAAEINVGENVPLQQNGFAGFPGLGGTGAAGGANPAAALGGLGALGGIGTTPQRQDVGTKVKIIPHLNESNEVRLELTEEISEAKAPQGALQVVAITKRTAQTTLVVKDQQTVVIGGLMRNRITHSQEKVPLLGDIPVLGALFRTTHSDLQKTNLILIMTPYIIREQADLRAVFERKMQERQEFLDRFFVFSDQQDYQPPHDYSRTNGLVEDIRQAFLSVDEKKKLEELTRPKETRGHVPSEPIEMPSGTTRSQGTQGTPGNGNAPPPSSPNAPPPVNVSPGSRSIERMER